MKNIITTIATAINNALRKRHLDKMESDYRAAFRHMTDSMNRAVAEGENITPVWKQDDVAVTASLGNRYFWGRGLYDAVTIEIGEKLRETAKGERCVGITHVVIN